MVNYKQGKIYKIECNVTGLIYIGSTCKQKLSQRMANHRSAYKKYLNCKGKYYSSFIVMENNDYEIILIEDYPCKSKDQLFARERYYTNEIKCVNIRKNQGLYVGLCKKECAKLYYETNKDKIKDYKKEYRKENADEIKIKKKEYYDKSSDKIKAKHNEKFSCLCGGKFIHGNRSTHLRSKKHQKYVEEQTENDD